MLMPARVKYRKQQKGHMRGIASRGASLSFGDVGLQSLSCGRITSRQIEAGRIAINRHAKRGGKVWIRIFPHKPISKKPLETRMGKGKGPPEYWVAVVKPGTVLYEIQGVTRDVAVRAMELAAQKMPVRCRILTIEEGEL